MTQRMSWFPCALLAIAMLVAACGTAQKDATEAAINAAETAIHAVQDQAEKYVPDQLHAAQATLQSAKDALAKGDYPAALNAAKDAASKARELAAAAAAKQQEWSKEWADTSASMPKSLDEIKAKLNAYSHGARLPAGMDKTALGDAKTQYDHLRQTWDDASAAASQGRLGDAIDKVTGIKDSVVKLKELLGIKS